MTTIYFIILCFATWRLTKMLVDEKGPYDILVKLREAVVNKPWSPLFCFSCTSIWVSFGLALLMHLPLETFLLYWLAASGVSIFMRKIFDKME